MLEKTEIQKLQDDLAQWSDQQFGHNRPPTRPINHLKREIDELSEAPNDPMEYADCLLLLIDAFRMAGGNADELVEFGFKKLAINRQRKWGKPDAHGVTEHIE